jgi:imidazole glycerol-phosphate synthase subunit HisH
MTTIVDLGVGNLGNVARAIEHVGGTAEVTADPKRIAASRRLILPGVGAFSPPREALRGAIEEALRSALASGAWLLGICVGFQLLFEASEEFGTTDGLGLLPGRIVRLPDGVPLPHIGWNRLQDLAEHPLLAGLPTDPWVYFVHSFAPEGSDSATLARTTHGRSFTAVAAKGRVLGCQFHPERSGTTGLKILANFLALGQEETA